MTESVADVVREMKMCGDRDECWERGMSDNSWPTRIEAAHAREIAEILSDAGGFFASAVYRMVEHVRKLEAEIEDLKRILIRYEGVRLGPEVEP